MYKVFIDHKPVVFTTKEELSTDKNVVKAKEITSAEELKPFIKKASIAEPVFLISKNPKKAFKSFFESHKKIEAAGGIVKRKEKYLVIKRKGLWDIPKGRIDKGESAEHACVREIMEECGIEEQKIVGKLTETYHTMKWNGQPALKHTQWYMLTYNGPKETRPEVKEEITEAKWMTREKMMSIRKKTFGSINEVLDAFEKNYPVGVNEMLNNE